MLVIAALIALERPVFSLLTGVPLLRIFFGILTALPKARDVLLASTINKSASESYTDRASQSVVDYMFFLRQPLLGFGWGKATNFNGITTLLSNVGLVGTTIFLACGLLTLGSLTLSARSAHEDDWRLVAYAAGVRNALIVAAVCAMTSGMKYVFLNDWVFWGLGIAIASRLEVSQRAKQAQSWMPTSSLREPVAL